MKLSIKLKSYLYKFIAYIIINFLFILNVFALQGPNIKPKLNTDKYCVIDMVTKRVLYSSNKDERVYPSDTVKLLTAMIAYDKLDDKLPVTIVSESVITKDGPILSSFEVGESYSKSDIIRGLMMPANNDASIARTITVTIARRDTNNKELPYDDCVKYFANLMNEKAKSYGANSSNFINAQGYHNDNNYSTPYDMAMIASHIIDYPDLEKIVGETHFKIEDSKATGLIHKAQNIYNKSDFLTNPYVGYKYATGIKGGYSKEAGYCLIASAKKDNKNFIITLFNDKDGPTASLDAKNMLDFAFDKYKNLYSINENEIIDKVHLTDASRFSLSNVEIYTDRDITIPYLTDESIDFEYNFDTNIIKNLNGKYVIQKDVVKNEKLGTLSIKINDKSTVDMDIYANNNIKKQTNIDYILYKVFIEKLGILMLAIFICLVLVVVKLIRKRNK